MVYAPAAWRRAMKVQQVLLKAMSGEYKWFEAAQILGISPRSLRRWRRRYRLWGYDGLLDARRRTPSPRRVPFRMLQKLLQLYRTRFMGFNVRHFLEIATREHGITLSYTYVKQALQEAGLVARRKSRGRHRLRRERRNCFGEMLHLDGSPHAWLALRPEERSTLIAVIDDATSQVLYAQLERSESTETVMTALRSVVQTHGIPACLYTDRAPWAFHTPTAGQPVDKDKLTQIGRALQQLGVEHIPAYSPQARGRGERLNRTFQDRLVNELKLRGITTQEAANRYLETRFLPHHNRTFARQPRESASAFVTAGQADLEQIFCNEEVRTVARDNTVVLAGVRLQIAKQPGRRSCEGLKVLVRRHLDGRHSIWLGRKHLGSYSATGSVIQPSAVA